jgi:HSP20 family protein
MVYRTTLAAAPVFSLRREIDRLFEDTFGQNGPQGGSGWTPAVNVREDDKDLTFTVDLPGVKPDQVEITVENGILTIRGERQETRTEGDDRARYHIVERSSGAFMRSFQLPKGLDESKIDAQFEDGVLTVHVPKSALPEPKRVEIKFGSQQAIPSASQPAAQSGTQSGMRAGSGMQPGASTQAGAGSSGSPAGSQPGAQQSTGART